METVYKLRKALSRDFWFWEIFLHVSQTLRRLETSEKGIQDLGIGTYIYLGLT